MVFIYCILKVKKNFLLRLALAEVENSQNPLKGVSKTCKEKQETNVDF
jgi:hypothetical protein